MGEHDHRRQPSQDRTPPKGALGRPQAAYRPGQPRKWCDDLGDRRERRPRALRATQTVNAARVAPAITPEPRSQSVTTRQTASYTAAANGNPTPTVQWQVSMAGSTTFTPVAGATSATLTLSSVTTAQSGNQYRAVFTNSQGSATSSAATLTVNAAAVAPTISTQPANQTVTAGQTATVSAGAAGTAPVCD